MIHPKINFNIRFVFIMLILISLLNCKKDAAKKASSSEELVQEESLYRPNFHFTPKKNWMNDPNGMFYLDGTYHLFFQYYPEGNVWGPMHWGHATTRDLVNWTEKDIALYPDSLGYIFSGSAVVDHLNTTNFAESNEPPVVAIFTYHDPKGEKEDRIDFQYQAIAYSNDKGESWTKFDGNPVLPNPGIKDFRDPKVVWDEERQQWVMALATYSETYFYGSKDLKSWSFLSKFGKEYGAHGGVWECPDFFPMQVNGTEETKWVLLQSLNPGSANGGSGTQYFVGDFDGKEFKLDPDFKKQLDKSNAIWLDFGRDNYAGVSWSNIPKSDGRTLFIGWMSNWDYAQQVPTEAWRSTMTIVRELNLEKDDYGFKLKSKPAREIWDNVSLVKQQRRFESDKSIAIADSKESDLGNTIIKMTMAINSKVNYKFDLSNGIGNTLAFGIDNEKKAIYIDRRASGKTDFSEKFSPSVSYAEFNSLNEFVDLTIVLDKTSIELFVNEGEVVMTELFFPEEPMNELTLTASQYPVKIELLEVYTVESKH